MHYEPLMQLIGVVGRNRYTRWCFCGLVLMALGVTWSLRTSHAHAQASAGVARCHVSLPMTVGGWNTLLAECDGQPVTIGPPPEVPVAEVTRTSMMSSAEYARDMQAIRYVLSSRPPPIPTWVPIVATLLGLAFIGGLAYVFRGLLRLLSNIEGWRRARPSVQAFVPGGGDALGDALTVAMHPPLRRRLPIE